MFSDHFNPFFKLTKINVMNLKKSADGLLFSIISNIINSKHKQMYSRMPICFFLISTNNKNNRFFKASFYKLKKNT